MGAEDPTAGLGALGAFGDAGNFSTQGGVLTVFGLKPRWPHGNPSAGNVSKLEKVTIWSVPTGAIVYFVPEEQFTLELIKDSSLMERYRLQEGPTDLESWQLERLYAVVFECGDSVLKVLRNVSVRGGANNRVGLRLRHASCE
jgi:hypothetical protein